MQRGQLLRAWPLLPPGTSDSSPYTLLVIQFTKACLTAFPLGRLVGKEGLLQCLSVRDAPARALAQVQYWPPACMARTYVMVSPCNICFAHLRLAESLAARKQLVPARSLLREPWPRGAQVDGDLWDTARFVDSVRLPYIAPSLGGVESLIEQPTVISYWDQARGTPSPLDLG